MTQHAYLTLLEIDFRRFDSLRKREAGRQALKAADARGWSLHWDETGDFSMAVAVVSTEGRELARLEVLKPSWWEREGAEERRMAEAEAEVVAEALRRSDR